MKSRRFWQKPPAANPKSYEEDAIKKHKIAEGIAALAPGFWAARVKNPIFVVGSARSGTTLLADLLGAHPDVAHWSEANAVWDPHGHPWNPALGTLPDWIDPHAYHARWWRGAEPRARMIRATFGIFQGLTRKSHFLNKSPYNTFRIPQLLDMFPEARFIHIYRDGRAVCSSRLLKNPSFIKSLPLVYEPGGTVYDLNESLLKMAWFWRENIIEVRKQDAALKLSERGLLYETSYENLCQDAKQVLAEIFQFAHLNPQRMDWNSLPRIPESRNFKWRENLDADLVKRMVEHMQPHFTELGYIDSNA